MSSKFQLYIMQLTTVRQTHKKSLSVRHDQNFKVITVANRNQTLPAFTNCVIRMISLCSLQRRVIALLISLIGIFSRDNLFENFQTIDVVFVNDTLHRIDSATSRRLQLSSSVPDLSKQTPEEANYLDYHRCFGNLIIYTYQLQSITIFSE